MSSGKLTEYLHQVRTIEYPSRELCKWAGEEIQRLQDENKQLTERVAVLEGALTQILGWRELRDTPYVPINRIEEIAKQALEDSV